MSTVRGYVDLSSTFRMRMFLIAGVLIVGIIAGCGGDRVLEGVSDDERIPEKQLRYAGKVTLELRESVELGSDQELPGIGFVYWMGISPEGTLMVTDSESSQAHEINYRDGKYIRSFGRTGNGPGEHSSAYNMSIDPEGRVYLLDKRRGQILRYDRMGRYLDRTESIGVSKIHAGRKGEVFFLRVNSSLIMELQRLDPATWGVLSSTPLSDLNQGFLSFRYSNAARLCYNASLQAYYYLGPNDYMVKEIDAVTGEITAKFGRRPNGFVALPDRYHDIGRGTFDDVKKLRITKVGSMTLVEDRYLFVSYNHPRSPGIEWVVYMINSSGTFEVFDLDDVTSRRLQLRSEYGGVPWAEAITAAQEYIYIWRPPRREVADRSIGTLEKYSIVLDLN
ncbi:MAG: 6-bladed beta-propeller [Gemmatimonadetes bacterium]|nr:6-bladed beta-propeller [Gemmatimonadota bacterium]